jgi:hypothetical protein
MKNKYKIYSKEDIINLLELSVDTQLYMFDCNLKYRQVINSDNTYILIKYNKDRCNYLITSVQCYNEKPHNLSYFRIDTLDLIDWLWKYRKFYNKTMDIVGGG